VRLQFITAVLCKIQVVRDVTPCRWAVDERSAETATDHSGAAAPVLTDTLSGAGKSEVAGYAVPWLRRRVASLSTWSFLMEFVVDKVALR
jgi:hypothetical protein